MNHTEEPWIDNDSEDCTHPVIWVPGQEFTARLMSEEDYLRAAECVNFCAGTDTEYLVGAGNLGLLLGGGSDQPAKELTLINRTAVALAEESAKEIKRLREALRSIAEHNHADWGLNWPRYIGFLKGIARAALATDKPVA